MIDLPSSRRRFLAASGVAGVASVLPALPAFAADAVTSLPEDAFAWGLPLVLSGRYLELARQHGVEFNRFYVSPDLATPATRAAGPNIDTLYGFGWLDLAAGPQIIAVPDTRDRYYSIQLLDVYGDSFAYIGRRATGTRAGAFALTAPGWTGTLPSGVTAIPAPTGTVLALLRTLVSGPADLPAARAIHAAYTTGPLSAWPAGRQAGTVRAEALNVFPAIDLGNAGVGYFDELDALVGRYPPLPEDTANFARLRPLGIGSGPRSADQAGVLAAAVPGAYARVRARGLANATVVNGWRSNLRIVPFIRDPWARAANNIVGPGAHIREEALYFHAGSGPDGRPLDGAGAYRLRFAPGQTPPVDAFWSLILYDRNFFLFDNPDHRYAFNDRTPDLHYAPDDSLEIVIAAERPSGAANWLPAPRDSFQLMVRFYQPRASVLDGSYRLPALERLA
jgi:hypothetical protein